MRVADLVLRAAHVALLRCASILVPLHRREDWYREWTGELSYARRSCAPAEGLSWETACTLTSLCLGSIQDAICLRRMEPTEEKTALFEPSSARQCILWLAALVGLSIAIAGLLPGIQSQNDAAQEGPRRGALVIENAHSATTPNSSIPFRTFQTWNSVHQEFFTNLAFYWTQELPASAMEGTRKLRVAYASQDLLKVAGITAQAGSGDNGADENEPRVLLSGSTWRKVFDSNPAVVGITMWIDHHPVRIAGIVPDEAWRLPEKPDLWVLESGVKLAHDSAHRSGYVIARLSHKGQGMMFGDAVEIAEFAPNGEQTAVFGTRLASQVTGTLSLYLFSLLLAMLAMPAVISVFQSESDVASHQPSLRVRARGWIFLGVKFGMVAALGYWGGADLAYAGFPGYSPSAQVLQLFFGFLICLAGFRWAIKDQSRRCPVCLGMVTHPAQVGIASCNFLGWNGTEMVCMGGHTLLHVPNLPTSWFSRQRWTYLDKSWDFLFAAARNQL